MRLGAVRSELIASLGFSTGSGQVGTLRIKYKDGVVFCCCAVLRFAS
jgi:hypothetical protein